LKWHELDNAIQVGEQPEAASGAEDFKYVSTMIGIFHKAATYGIQH